MFFQIFKMLQMNIWVLASLLAWNSTKKTKLKTQLWDHIILLNNKYNTRIIKYYISDNIIREVI